MLMDTHLLIKAKAPKIAYRENMIKDLVRAMRAFTQGETGIFGNYVAVQNALVYRTVSAVEGENDVGQDILVVRLVRDGNVFYIGNSSSMKYCGTKIAFGNGRSGVRGQCQAQRDLQAMGIPLLPFDAFIEAGLKILDTEIVDQTGDETVTRLTDPDQNGKRKKIDVHFTGASLFRNGTKTFLFDIDREEIKHGIFNPFIVELNAKAKVQNVKQAYESLIPKEVIQAKANGSKVLRQGEYFFIKVAKPDAFDADPEPTGDRYWDRLKDEADAEKNKMRGVLSAQGNRDHITSLFNRKTGYVSGIVVHWGREHNNLNLRDGWYKPVPNTAVRSFTLSGDVD